MIKHEPDLKNYIKNPQFSNTIFKYHILYFLLNTPYITNQKERL